MKIPKIIDKIYATNTPIPSHLKGNVLEIKNTSDKNYNLKVGNTLVSPVCSVDSLSALEKESNGRIGTLGIVASQSTRTRS